jgi:hypothetical protein
MTAEETEMSDRARNYSQMHREFLRRNFPKVYWAFQRRGALEEHVRDIGKQAAQMYECCGEQMVNSPNLPVDAKARAQALGAIPLTVEELVLH